MFNFILWMRDENSVFFSKLGRNAEGELGKLKVDVLIFLQAQEG